MHWVLQLCPETWYQSSCNLGPHNFSITFKLQAHGNNPCLPYDLCVKTFAGSDADIIHWEQQYNCWGNDWSWAFEQFVRQSYLLQNHPVVVFAESSTPNWGEKDCDNPSKTSHEITPIERELLLALDSEEPRKIATEISAKKIIHEFNHLTKIMQAYKTAGGVQVFRHAGYEDYKCLGPYEKKWGCCSASWHPSLLGHELRASHHAFHWLLVLQDAVKDITLKLRAGSAAQALLDAADKHLESTNKHFPATPVHPSQPQITDGLSCFSEYEPRAERTNDLVSRVVGTSLSSEGWKREMFEYLMPDGHNAVRVHKERFGHLDRRFMIMSTKAKDSGPLNFNIHVAHDGPSFVCQPPGEWGTLPKGFKSFWEIGTLIYVTQNTGDFHSDAVAAAGFVFDANKAHQHSYTNRKPKDTQTVCVELDKHLPLGDHVLSIVPTAADQNIMIGVLLIA